jgi:hypothetical protein
MIVPLSLRDNHPQDTKIVNWVNSIEKSERSREIRKALLWYLENKGEIQKIKKFEETVITQNTEHNIEHKTETDTKQQTTATLENAPVEPTETKEITPTTPTINLDVKFEDIDISQFNQFDSFESDNKKEKINKLMKLGKNN